MGNKNGHHQKAMMTLNTVEATGSVVVCIFTGCVDVDVGFAETVFTGLLMLTVTDIDGALRHKHQPLLKTHRLLHSKN